MEVVKVKKTASEIVGPGNTTSLLGQHKEMDNVEVQAIPNQVIEAQEDQESDEFNSVQGKMGIN